MKDRRMAGVPPPIWAPPRLVVLEQNSTAMTEDVFPMWALGMPLALVGWPADVAEASATYSGQHQALE
eukprot:4296374-Alexandrium_andersonii.AAC.1